MKKIYIAKDYNNNTVGIVLADDPKIANAYFVGRGQIPHAMNELDLHDERLGVLGLCVLFRTREVKRHEMRMSVESFTGPDFIVEETQ
jgi:hypothetical protein